MKERIRLLSMKALAALCLTLCVAPLNVLMGRRILPDWPMMWYLLPTLSLLWGVAGYLLPRKARLPFAMAGCALLAGGCILFLMPHGWQTLLLLVPCWTVLLLLPPAYARPIWDEWPPGLWTAGVFFHLTGQLLATRADYSGTAGALSVAGAAYALLLMITANRQNLHTSMHGNQKAPTALRRRNLALVLALFALAMLAACWQALSAWLNAVGHNMWQGVKRMIAWLMSLFLREEAVFQGGMGGGSMDLSALGEAVEPSAFARLMEKVAILLAAVALLALAFLAGRFLFRWLHKQLRGLLAHLRRYAASAGEAYVDEAESTLNLDERARALKEKLKRGFIRAPRRIPWQELDGRARVRRLYQQYLCRNPEAHSLTAREALEQTSAIPRADAGAFAALYERARYSDHSIDPQEADRLRERLK